MVDWSTLACGRGGHVTFAPDEPELSAQMGATLPDGRAWQCLRCGSYVRGEPTLSGPAATAPVVPRGKEVRSRLILRLFAVERFLRAIVIGTAAVGLWQFRHSQTSIEQSFDRDLPALRGLFRQLGYNIDNSKLVGLLQHALTLSSKTLTLLAIGLALYAIIELVEGVGLWLARRWGEYFAMVATSLGLPLEIYDLTRNVTALRCRAVRRQPGPRAVPGHHQAAVRRARRQGGLRRPAAQRVGARGSREGSRRARRPASSQPAAVEPASTRPPSASIVRQCPPRPVPPRPAPPRPVPPSGTAQTGPAQSCTAQTGSGRAASGLPATASVGLEQRLPSGEPVGNASDGHFPK